MNAIQPIRHACLVALCCAPGFAQDVKPLPDPAAEVADLSHAFDADERAPKEKYDEFAPRFTAFADAHRGTEPEVTARLWLLQQSWWLRESGKMESTATPIAEGLIARHLGSSQLAKLPGYAYVFAKPDRERLFSELLQSPIDAVQAAAHLGLARLAPPAPGWRAKSAEDIEKSHPHLAVLRSKFAALPCLASTYGEIADALLEQLTPKDLAVGATAPEIVGADQDGKTMHLSDFRGKVVLLDFWGDW